MLVVGGGPGGLRAAIELALLGCDVTVIEKRRSFLRHNLLHLWPNSIRDLKNIGVKVIAQSFIFFDTIDTRSLTSSFSTINSALEESTTSPFVVCSVVC